MAASLSYRLRRPGHGALHQIVQRFGWALNLNVHLHALVLDGVFADGANGADGTSRFLDLATS